MRIYWFCGSCACWADRRCYRSWMGRGVLGFCGLEAVAPAEGELLLGRGEVERALADLICLHARKQLRRTGHNKIICRFIKLIIGSNKHSSLLHS